MARITIYATVPDADIDGLPDADIEAALRARLTECYPDEERPPLVLRVLGADIESGDA